MRALRRTLIVLAVLACVFVAVDRLAVYLAEKGVTEKVTAAQGLSGSESVTVSVNGFPFVTQVLSKQLDEVDIEITGMTAAAGGREITVTHLEATLFDVDLADDYSSATAQRATGSAKFSYAALNKIAPEGVTVSYAGKERAARNQVKITASVDVLGRELEVPKPIYSSVEITEDGDVRLRADEVPGAGIPGAEEQVRKRVDFGTGVRGLPSGLAVDEAKVTKRGVTVIVAGTDVALG